jgi:sugar phosphate isomerase/epimerase
MYSVYEMLQIKEWCDELGLKVKGVHASEGEGNSDMKRYSSANEYSRLAGIDLIKNRIDMAYILGTEYIVLHLRAPWDYKDRDTLNAFLQPALKSFSELEPYCRTRHIKICIENTGGSAAQCCPIYDTLYGRFDADYLGLCFDTGHANNNCKDDLLAYPKRYKDRLFMVHVEDNHGEGPDEHLLPFDGTFDWESFAAALARSAYQFPIVMEPDCRKEGMEPYCSQGGDDTAWLKKAFDTGSRFAAMVEKHRSINR